MSAFLKPAEHYKRQINPIQQYVGQMGLYLSRMSGKPKDLCETWVKDGFRNKTFQDIRNPTVTYFERGDNGDRSPQTASLSNVISSIVANEEILAPTMTTYWPPHQKPSMAVGFVEYNKAQRSVHKKAEFKAKMIGDTEIAIVEGLAQNNKKIFNNAMSGSFGTSSSVLENPSAHSTLTSIVRTVTSIGNASNEKLLAGNRHYFNSDITLNNLISIVSQINVDTLTTWINQYNIHIPTVEDTVKCIKRSTDLYWVDPKAFIPIVEWLNVLTGIERAAIVYYGDLYHVRMFNSDFTRTFLYSLSKKGDATPVLNPVDYIESTDELIVNIAQQICLAECKGVGKDYSKMPIEHVYVLANTVKNIQNALVDYSSFIEAVFLTDTLPNTTAHIRDMIRRVVVLSDTDSTMFSVDDYIEWYFGKILFTDEAIAIASATMFVTTQAIAHNLAIMSANLGVSKKKLFALAMKPEFSFNVFALTSVAKHYYTGVWVREGNIYKEMEMEIKGVHLKNSAAPKALILAAQDRMRTIIETIAAGEQIHLLPELEYVAGVETKIMSEISSGSVDYYKYSKVKEAEAYAKGPKESPYAWYTFWRNVFQASYGEIAPPPYRVIKIPTILLNKTAVLKWVTEIEDQELAMRLKHWLVEHNKTTLPTIYLSVEYAKGFGVPKEILQVANPRAVALDLTGINRMVLETLGYFPKHNMLLSESGW